MDAANTHTLYLYSTTVSDVGTARSNNQDSSFAGNRLAAVCDGMGGHAGGDTASTIAIRSLAHIEQDETNDCAEVVRKMETSVIAAHDAIAGRARREHTLAGMGTTLTAITLVKNYWILAHIGDSRAYLMRNGHLSRMSSDHSYVQHLIDIGSITEAEAKNHPQRNMVMRVLGDFDIDPSPDIAMFPAQPADRWLLCSDGMSGVLEESTIAQELGKYADIEECAQILVSMALKAGSTDNVTVVIVDASMPLDPQVFGVPSQHPLIGGAASASMEAIANIINTPVASAPPLTKGTNSPAAKAAALRHQSGGVAGDGANGAGGVGCSSDADHSSLDDDLSAIHGLERGSVAAASESADCDAATSLASSASDDSSASSDTPLNLTYPSSANTSDEIIEVDTGEIPVIQKSNGHYSSDPHDPEVREQMEKEQAIRKARKRVRRRIIATVVSLLFVVCVVLGGWFTYQWTQSRYFLSTDGSYVTINQGLNTDIFGYALYHEVERTSISTKNLPQSWIEQLEQGIQVDSYSEAKAHAQLIRTESESLEEQKNTSSTGQSSSSTTNSSRRANYSEPTIIVAPHQSSISTDYVSTTSTLSTISTTSATQHGGRL